MQHVKLICQGNITPEKVGVQRTAAPKGRIECQYQETTAETLKANCLGSLSEALSIP